jgi:apolipoprotein N-acyltransferase
MADTKPAAPPPPADRTPALACVGLALASGGLLWACYHPLAWGWLGWVALVPVLGLARSKARPRAIYWSAYLGGSLFFWAAIQWMRVADYRMYATWAMLSVYCALYFPLGIFLIRLIERRTSLPFALNLPIVWVALEYCRSVFGTGFGWYLLGYTQHDTLPMIQIADLGGVFAVSFVVAAVNAVLFALLYEVPAVRRVLRLNEPAPRVGGWDWGVLGLDGLGVWRAGVFAEAGAVVGLVLATLAYGMVCLEHTNFPAGPRVALLQGNLDQRLRNDAAADAGLDPQEARRKAADRHKKAISDVSGHYAKLLGVRFTPPADLIVWPETSYPQAWIQVDPDLPIDRVPEFWRDAEAATRDHFRTLAKLSGTPHLLGMNTNYLDAAGKPRNYNSALLLTRQGNVESRYDKMHRVPFGEYVPLRDWLPFMDWFAPYDYDYSIRSGEHFTRFELPADEGKKYHFGVLICYEDTDHLLAKHYAVADDDGPPVDFLVNISNDGWFDGSSEHDEHLAISRFRAVECRRALARSVNMGISAVIDGNGRVLRPVLANKAEMEKTPDTPPLWAAVDQRPAALPHREWASFKKVAGVLVATIPLDRRTSLYAALGDWLPGACWVTIIGVAAWAVVRRRRAPAAA